MALRVNPHDIDALKDTIMRAVAMPGAEQGRMRALRRKVIENDVDAWSHSFLDALENAKKRHAPQAPATRVHRTAGARA